jgi:kynurenine formamidase
MCFHFIGTGISKDAAEYIVKTRDVYGVGLDTPSLDPGKKIIFEAHRTLFEARIFGIENLHLEKGVLPGNYTKLLTFIVLHLTPS